jgi:hypothetical protein
MFRAVISLVISIIRWKRFFFNSLFLFLERSETKSYTGLNHIQMQVNKDISLEEIDTYVYYEREEIQVSI